MHHDRDYPRRLIRIKLIANPSPGWIAIKKAGFEKPALARCGFKLHLYPWIKPGAVYMRIQAPATTNN